MHVQFYVNESMTQVLAHIIFEIVRFHSAPLMLLTFSLFNRLVNEKIRKKFDVIFLQSITSKKPQCLQIGLKKHFLCRSLPMV